MTNAQDQKREAQAEQLQAQFDKLQAQIKEAGADGKIFLQEKLKQLQEMLD